ncbi:Dpy-30 motif, partial [Trinorchestia longiramus]
QDTSNGGGKPRKKARMDMSSMTSRQYLDQTIVPILLQGIAQLAKERPEDPVDFLAKFL